jgi:hypothetical protein
VALAGCRTASVKPDDPAGPVQIRSVTPTYKSDGGADFTVSITFANPDPQPGSATRVTWRIWLQKHRFAEGEQLIAQPIAAGVTTPFQLVLPLALRRAPAAADLVPVEFSIRGDLTAVIGGAERTFPFARTLYVSAPSSRSFGADED